MAGKQEQQRQGGQRDQNTGTGDRSNLGEQIPDPSRRGQSGTERSGSQTTNPNRESTERSGSSSGTSSTERDQSTQRNNPERGSQRS